MSDSTASIVADVIGSKEWRRSTCLEKEGSPIEGGQLRDAPMVLVYTIIYFVEGILAINGLLGFKVDMFC